MGESYNKFKNYKGMTDKQGETAIKWTFAIFVSILLGFLIGFKLVGFVWLCYTGYNYLFEK